jgi:hypothetical protein
MPRDELRASIDELHDLHDKLHPALSEVKQPPN